MTDSQWLGRFTLALSLALSAFNVSAQPQTPVPDRVPRDIKIRLDAAKKYLELAQRYNGRNAVFMSGKTVQCETGQRCPVDVELTELFAPGGGSPLACLVKTPEIKVKKVGSATHTRLVWTLILPPNPQAAYQFEQDDGLLVIVGERARLVGRPVSATELRKRHEYTGSGKSITYFPIVLQNFPSAPLMCAAGDPTIVNN